MNPAPVAPKIDARTLHPLELERMRQAIVADWKSGETLRAISERNGMSYSGVSKITQRYAAAGDDSFAVKKRGNKTGAGRLLSEVQEHLTRQCIENRQPIEVGIPYKRWNCAAVGAFLQQSFGITLLQRTVWNYLTRWGMAPRRVALCRTPTQVAHAEVQPGA